jgi:hypothetical protein
VDVIGVGDEIRLVQQAAVQRDVGLDPVDHVFVQRALQAHHAFLAGPAIGDQLGDQGIVLAGHGIAGIERRIDADAIAARRVIGGHRAGRRHEADRVLGVDAAFDRMAGEVDRRLVVA